MPAYEKPPAWPGDVYSVTAFASGGEESTESVAEQETTGDVSDLLSALAGSQVSSWATANLAWANAEGLISGNQSGGQTYLLPQGNATRAQVAAILMRYVARVAKNESG